MKDPVKNGSRPLHVEFIRDDQEIPPSIQIGVGRPCIKGISNGVIRRSFHKEILVGNVVFLCQVRRGCRRLPNRQAVWTQELRNMCGPR